MEIWKPIPCTNGEYFASSLGKIKGVDRIRVAKGTQYKVKDRILKTQICRIGYETVKIPLGSGKRNTKRMKVHRLVALAFIENNLGKKEVNHINGIKTDNRPENLEWVSRKDNMVHARDNNMLSSVVGSKNPFSKLTDLDVLEIKELLGSIKDSNIASVFNVHPSTIYKIRKGISWSHIKL